MRMKSLVIGLAVATCFMSRVEAQTLDTSFSPSAACVGAAVTLTVVFTNDGGISEASWQANNDGFLWNDNMLGACVTDLGSCQIVSQSTTTWDLDPLPAGATSTTTIAMHLVAGAVPGSTQCTTTNATVNSTDSSDEACVTVLGDCTQRAPALGGAGLAIAVCALAALGLVAQRRTRRS